MLYVKYFSVMKLAKIFEIFKCIPDKTTVKIYIDQIKFNQEKNKHTQKQMFVYI